MEKKVDALKKIIEESGYLVALCGSGMMRECGYLGLKIPEKAYEIEQRFGESPEDIFTSVYFNNRPEQFYKFYKEEVLQGAQMESESYPILRKMEELGKLKCIITSNIYELPQKSGCENVINLHGSIYNNICPHCRKEYSIEYIKNSKKAPLCEDCSRILRPQVALFGEMMDSQLMTKATWEIECADVLLLLGTTLDSEVFSKYVKYFDGDKLVVIHKGHHHSDVKADLAILDEPKNVLSKLGY